MRYEAIKALIKTAERAVTRFPPGAIYSADFLFSILRTILSKSDVMCWVLLNSSYSAPALRTACS